MTTVNGPLVLVDASNVIHTGEWIDRAGTDLYQRGERLVDACASWASLADCKVVLVFDGTGPYGVPGERSFGDHCTVVATVGDTADSWIEREATICRAGGRVYWVVSSDGDVRNTAGAAAQRVIDSVSFVAEILHLAPTDAEIDLPGDTPPQRLGDTLDDETRARLEGIRRGLLPET